MLLRRSTVVLALGLAGSGCRYQFERVADANDDARVDAMLATPPADAGTCLPAECAAAGGTCEGAVCQLVSAGEGLLRCPASMPCRVICEGYRFCRDGTDCGGATWCEVRCIGFRTCQSGVRCGASDCVVTCDGAEACEAGIQATGVCESHCCGSQTCAGGVGSCTSDATCS